MTATKPKIVLSNTEFGPVGPADGQERKPDARHFEMRKRVGTGAHPAIVRLQRGSEARHLHPTPAVFRESDQGILAFAQNPRR